MASKIEFKSAGFPVHTKQYWDQPWVKFRREWMSVLNSMISAWGPMRPAPTPQKTKVVPVGTAGGKSGFPPGWLEGRLGV